MCLKVRCHGLILWVDEDCLYCSNCMLGRPVSCNSSVCCSKQCCFGCRKDGVGLYVSFWCFLQKKAREPWRIKFGVLYPIFTAPSFYRTPVSGFAHYLSTSRCDEWNMVDTMNSPSKTFPPSLLLLHIVYIDLSYTCAVYAIFWYDTGFRSESADRRNVSPPSSKNRHGGSPVKNIKKNWELEILQSGIK